MESFTGCMDDVRHAAFERIVIRAIQTKSWVNDPLMWFDCFYTALGQKTPVYVCWSLIKAEIPYYSISPCPIKGQGNWTTPEYEIRIFSQKVIFLKNGTQVITKISSPTAEWWTDPNHEHGLDSGASTQ